MNSFYLEYSFSSTCSCYLLSVDTFVTVIMCVISGVCLVSCHDTCIYLPLVNPRQFLRYIVFLNQMGVHPVDFLWVCIFNHR